MTTNRIKTMEKMKEGAQEKEDEGQKKKVDVHRKKNLINEDFFFTTLRGGDQMEG